MTDEQTDDTVCPPTSPRVGEGERALLRALLGDAMRCLLGDIGGGWGDRARLAADARAWITNRGDAMPFSFENVCAWLDLPAARLRRYLLEQEARGASSAPSFAPAHVRAPGIHPPRVAARA
jgi:hypothetical protein